MHHKHAFICLLKNISFYKLFIFVIFHCSEQAYSFSILDYEVQNYPRLIHKIINDDHSEIYKISLDQVNNYLPFLEPIKKASVQSLDERLLPMKALIKLMRIGFRQEKNGQSFLTPLVFFYCLQEGVPYTYVVTDRHLIFAKSTHFPEKEKWRDKFSKHYFIAGLKKSVRYAGEFTIVKASDEYKVAVIFDNASGTFRPKTKHLSNLQNLLRHNFKQKNLLILVKKFNQDVDREHILKRLDR